MYYYPGEDRGEEEGLASENGGAATTSEEKHPIKELVDSTFPMPPKGYARTKYGSRRCPWQ